MAPTMKDFGIDRLPAGERIALALELWESLGAGERPGAHLTEQQWDEIDRRDAELDADPGLAMTWEQVRASIRGER